MSKKDVRLTKEAYNAGDSAQVLARGLEEKFNRRQELDDARMLLNNEESRRFLASFIAWCGIGQSPFNTNALVMAKNVGRQEVGVYLMDLLRESSASLFATLEQEARERAQEAKV